ncbi:uncharacterized protein METZ01_LOCUS269261 [marine metagenome]|uniref:Uncharacterized protein n=1 Tax=marine metagenome TaxID=408172 RepID=A0A382JZY4_9ZZZZ
MEILIQERIEYGMRRTYPMNKLGKDYAERLGKKTLSHGDLGFISEMGVNITHVPLQMEWTNLN